MPERKTRKKTRSPKKATHPDVITASGGLLWRRSGQGREVALIRRERYGKEWTLPKGKLKQELGQALQA